MRKNNKKCDIVIELSVSYLILFGGNGRLHVPRCHGVGLTLGASDIYCTESDAQCALLLNYALRCRCTVLLLSANNTAGMVYLTNRTGV